MKLESDIKFELHTRRPPMAGAFEVIDRDDVLEINSEVDVQIILKDDVISLQAV